MTFCISRKMTQFFPKTSWLKHEAFLEHFSKSIQTLTMVRSLVSQGLEQTKTGVSLHIAKASFSWYLATRNANTSKPWPRANPIGTTSIVLSSDLNVVASLRSLKADQNPGALYYLGGFAEFSDDGTFDLFDNAEREVVEEIGLADEITSRSNTLIGLDYDQMFPHPEAFFLTRLNLSSKDLRAHLSSFKHEEAERFELYSLEVFLKLTNEAHPLTWSFETGRRFLKDFIRNGNLK